MAASSARPIRCRWLEFSDRPHIQQALRSRDFALRDYLINRIYQVPNLVATYPVIADNAYPVIAMVR